MTLMGIFLPVGFEVFELSEPVHRDPVMQGCEPDTDVSYSPLPPGLEEIEKLLAITERYELEFLPPPGR